MAEGSAFLAKLGQLTFFEVVLGMLELSLAALTLLVATIAIFGYFAIKREAITVAKETAKAEAGRLLDEVNVRDMLQQYVAREAERLYRDMEQSPTHELSTKEKEDV